ncbi:MAG TPA: isoprenylcysteine carboxylmethyltransferase family protein [Anaerolineales bacterium]|nr:isoprenylcysteine carboxylmethyltransferase family protein [Anaerolineales bacterium]
MATLTTVLGYLILAQFFYLDRSRRGAEAKSFEGGESDRRSTMYIGLAYCVSMLCLLASWMLNGLHHGTLPAWTGWLGLGIAALGLLFRWWANRVLGVFYTRTLRVIENQTIVRAGPYGVIRHPGYLGSILMWVGVAAATANWIVLLIVLAVMVAVYSYRIQNEEKMLLAARADYGEYRKHTWKLIPLIF